MARKAYRRVKEDSGEPQIGIFWVYRGQILRFTQPVSQVPAVGGFRDSSYGHDGFWKQMIDLFPELSLKEYFDIPRGRVLFAVNGVYHVLLPRKESKNRILVARV